ncbi:hypothetical protein B5S28_g971 [[Candida] boidinii]|nr:hypothetical protein B5S28_g971 [[Candida] boidinii]OWB61020.1 hypothetical protein B5S29_g1903 [[Candida] boidinii]OWB75263.1 hypothetical protein B5S31_g5138 [[Candida] boidinii]OWB77547.1 hypothetical protein B5S32_g1717 [[Candida] boidinii]
MSRINRSLILSRASPILNFYSKHRNFILRLCYVAILFGALSSSNGKKNKHLKNKSSKDDNENENEKDKILNSNYTNNEINNNLKKKNEKLNLLQKFLKPFKNFMNSQTIKILTSIDYTKEGKPIILYLVLQIAMLIIRAILTLKVASLDGLLVSSLVSRRFKKFFKLVLVWMLIGIPAALTNSFLNLSQRLLGKHIRFNVTKQLLDEYLPDDGNSTLYQLLTNNRDSNENSKKNSKDQKTLEVGGDKTANNTDSSSSSSSNKTIKIEDPNQRITLNVEQFSSSLSILPGQLLKPSLDILLCANQLAKSGGNTAEGVLALGLITNLSSLVLKMFTPNFIKLSQKSNELENKFHIYHSKIVNNNEEIALAKGHRREIDVIDSNYYELVKFKKFEMRRMAIYNFFMSFIVKYFWGASGLTLCAVPIFSEAYQRNFQISDHLMQNISATFITNRRLLLSGSSSLGRLIQSKKDIQNLIGYSDKVWEFHMALSQINNDRLVETSINGSTSANSQQLPSSQDSLPSIQDILSDSSNSTATNGSVALAKSDSLGSDSSFVAPLITGPNVLYGDCVKFDNIPLVTPKGDTLIDSLNFEIKTGQNLLIIGPNGCGKSSLFRILGGLWPVLNPGKLTIPNDKNDLFYLPQRAYLTIGTLKEQIIYPDSLEDYSKKLNRARLNNDPVVKDDEFLINLLNVVDLSHLVDECTNIIEERLEISNKNKRLIISESVTDLKELNGDSNSKNNNSISSKNLKRANAPLPPPLKRTNSKVAAASESFEDDDELNVIPESPLDLVRKWPNLLSVGEQQRLALARLYYHCPKFAVLDECTSSISPELEQKCYKYAVDNCKITVLSVCHRTSLWKFHNHILKFDGLGNAKFHKFDPELRLKKHDELIEIDNYLKNLNNLENKLKDLNHLKNSTLDSTNTDTLASLPVFANHNTTSTSTPSSSSSSSASGSNSVSGNNSPAPTRSSKRKTDRKKIMYIEG